MYKKYYKYYFYFLKKFSVLFTNEKCICCFSNTHFLPLCVNCDNKFLTYNDNISRCNNCGKILVSEENICTDCRENPVINNIHKIIPLFSYRLWNKELLYKWKIQGYRNFAYIFAKKVIKIYNKYFPDYFLVPVPPRPNKIKRRGWDQIDDLVKYIKCESNIKIINLLERTEYQQQKKLNRAQRLAHKGSSYILRKKYEKVKLPKKVVIIDDILTTGVTLENCAITLKNAGVETIGAITLFIAD